MSSPATPGAKRVGRGAQRRSSAGGKPFAPFAEHLSGPKLSAELLAGRAFEGTLRVNSRMRHQAYCTLPGLACDVLFDGFWHQNRAVRARGASARREAAFVSSLAP